MKAQQNIGTHIFYTPFGKIAALKKDGVIKARSIRYAYSERFQMPFPSQPSDVDVLVPEKIPVCPQNISPLLEKMIEETNVDSFEVNESPQYLTVTRPEMMDENDKLPVVVWIHGGSYEVGCGDLPTSDPSAWVKEQNIIVVSVSYRLGVFGFLGSNEERPPNLGLFDIIEALKWIKANIESFGGNPENIALFGQSSGGDAVAHLMITQGVEGLFNRVIIHSAPLGLRHNRQKMSEEFFRKTEKLKDEIDVMKMMEDYKHFVPSMIKYGLKAAMPFGLQYGFPPLCNENEAVDKWIENAKKYDVLIGMNDDETAFYLRTSEAMNKYLGKGWGQKILNRTIRLTTENIYGKPARIFAETYAKAGGNIYLFRLHSTIKNNYIGAAHCVDLPLIFGNESAWKKAGLLKDIPWEYVHDNGKKLRARWADFARTGNIPDDSDIPEMLELKKVVI
ncbi:carboxylesterase family protein [Chryseobacterium sp.]|uniref:carboxylesterase family protein n=1 Tax=Chryseobacterium sp. TaxID=1871047 RepID=UPI0025C23498|nr:carboxylesterase family protein [Chryseobacterium sp.]